MKRLIITLFTVSFLACQTSENKDSNNHISDLETISAEPSDLEPLNSEERISDEFWKRLSSLKGKTFQGEVIEAPEDDDFRGEKLVMHVLDVKADTIYIPFNVGDNRSRTWILTKKNNRIQLKHDHRQEDGSNDEVTMYGGVSTNTGFDTMLMFPADQETVDLLPRAAGNIWWITVDEKQFTYNLRRIGSSFKFSIGFNLESSIETPKRSWGWENYQG